MPDNDKQFNNALSDLANALQTAGLLAARHRRNFDDLARDAISLEAAIERAVHAVERLRRADGASDDVESASEESNAT